MPTKLIALASWKGPNQLQQGSGLPWAWPLCKKPVHCFIIINCRKHTCVVSDITVIGSENFTEILPTYIHCLTGYTMKTAVTTQIAQKSLRFSPKSQVDYTNGQRTSAIGADCSYIEQCFSGFVQIVVQPLTILIGFVLLILNLGPSALVVCQTCCDAA